MLTGLVRQSIRHRGVVIGLALALIVYGAGVVANARLDVFPEFAPPQVSIQTEAPGLSPEQVEVLVTKPLEDAINGVEGIAAVRSQSIQGLSVITAVLAEHEDIYRARQALAERLVEATGRLPATVEPPVLTPLTSSSSTVLVVGVTSTTRSLMEQRTFVDWVMRPRLLATPGVSKVAVFGGEVRELQVQLDPERLQALRRRRRRRWRRRRARRPAFAAPALSTAPISASRCERKGRRSRRTRSRRQSCASGTDPCSGSPISAGWSEAPATRFGEGGVDGRRGLVIVVSAQLGANTKVVAERAEAALARLEPRHARAGPHASARHLPAVGVHRPRAPQHRHLASARRGARGGGAADLSLRRGRRGHFAHGDPAVAARRPHRARSARLRHQHAHAGRPGHRARRGGGRRDHRRREHRAAAARESPVPPSRGARRASCSRRRSRSGAASCTPRSWWRWYSSRSSP